MEKYYTHIQVIGNAMTPERFYIRNLLTEDEVNSMKNTEGIIRLILSNESYLSDKQREALIK